MWKIGRERGREGGERQEGEVKGEGKESPHKAFHHLQLNRLLPLFRDVKKSLILETDESLTQKLVYTVLVL